jgi:hypothetical protein
MSSFPFDRENEQFDSETVTLVDETGRSLDCYIEHSLDTDDTTYLLLSPVDSPIVIMAWDDDNDDDEETSEAILIEDNEEIEIIFADAKAVLGELNLALQHTAFTLTAKGELPPLEEEKILSLQLEDEEEDGKTSLEPEELQFLASFYYEEEKYSLYTPLTPLLFFARYNDRDELELVSPDEKDLQPILHDLLFEDRE